jgi:hypothetical protein
VDKYIDNHPESIAQYIRHVQCMEAAAATWSSVVDATAHAIHIASLYKEK